MDIELEKKERELLNSDYIEPDEYGRSGYVIDYGDDPACGAPWGVRTVTLELPDGTILPAYNEGRNS